MFDQTTIIVAVVTGLLTLIGTLAAAWWARKSPAESMAEVLAKTTEAIAKSNAPLQAQLQWVSNQLIDSQERIKTLEAELSEAQSEINRLRAALNIEGETL